MSKQTHARQTHQRAKAAQDRQYAAVAADTSGALDPSTLISLRGAFLRKLRDPARLCKGGLFSEMRQLTNKKSVSKTRVFFTTIRQELLPTVRGKRVGWVEYVVKEFDEASLRRGMQQQSASKVDHEVQKWWELLNHEADVYRVTNALLDRRNTPNVVTFIGGERCPVPQGSGRSLRFRLITEAGFAPGHGYPLKNADPGVRLCPQVTFALVYTLACFQLVGLCHNDLHFGNVLVRDHTRRPIPLMGYRVSATQLVVLRDVVHVPLIYDYDQSSKRPTAADPVEALYPTYPGVSLEWLHWHLKTDHYRRDLFTLVCHLLRTPGIRDSSRRLLSEQFLLPGSSFDSGTEVHLPSGDSVSLGHTCLPYADHAGRQPISDPLPNRSPKSLLSSKHLPGLLTTLNDVGAAHGAPGTVRLFKGTKALLDEMMHLPHMYQLPTIASKVSATPAPSPSRARELARML